MAPLSLVGWSLSGSIRRGLSFRKKRIVRIEEDVGSAITDKITVTLIYLE